MHNVFERTRLFRLTATFAALQVAVAACSLTVGSGQATAEERTVEPFDTIELSSAVDLAVDVGGPHSVVVEGDEDSVGLIQTDVRGGRLIIETASERLITITEAVKVSVTTPSLAEISVTGSGTAVIEGVDAQEMSAVLDGSGTIEVEGSSERIDIDLSGSGDVDTTDLSARIGAVVLSGSGSVFLAASESLVADIDGSGSVSYVGEPSVESVVRGSGSIDAR